MSINPNNNNADAHLPFIQPHFSTRGSRNPSNLWTRSKSLLLETKCHDAQVGAGGVGVSGAPSQVEKEKPCIVSVSRAPEPFSPLPLRAQPLYLENKKSSLAPTQMSSLRFSEVSETFSSSQVPSSRWAGSGGQGWQREQAAFTKSLTGSQAPQPKLGDSTRRQLL